MSDTKKRQQENTQSKETGYQPIKKDGYQPSKGNLDPKNPPGSNTTNQGGGGKSDTVK